jgi:co-chaperonin GroES (HSP10)
MESTQNLDPENISTKKHINRNNLDFVSVRDFILEFEKPKETSKGGILLPEDSRKKSLIGKIVQIPLEASTKENKGYQYKVGDIVFIAPYTLQELPGDFKFKGKVEDEDTMYALCSDRSFIGIASTSV